MRESLESELSYLSKKQLINGYSKISSTWQYNKDQKQWVGHNYQTNLLFSLINGQYLMLFLIPIWGETFYC